MAKKKNKKDKGVKSSSSSLLIWVAILAVWLFIVLMNFKGITNNNDSIWDDLNVKTVNGNSSNKDMVKKALDKNAKKTIVDFYSSINKADFNWYFLVLDKVLRSNDGMRTYFSQSRIDTFLKKLDWNLDIQKISEISEYFKKTEYSIKKWFNYTLKYKVDWKDYIENWEMVLMSYDGWDKFYINSLFCTTENCSKNPFYN